MQASSPSWLDDTDGWWVQGWWHGYQQVGPDLEYSVSEDYMDGFHVGLRIAKLDACGVGDQRPNDFYGQRVGSRE